MSTLGERSGLQRPYTLGTFQSRLNDFEALIREITLQDVEASAEERRQMITENLRYDQFCDSIRALFGNDIRNQDLKSLFRKITNNPDANVDWSELFGYFQSDSDEQEMLNINDDSSVFMASAKKRIGEAAGDKKRRDTVQCIRYLPSLDCYLTASQKGALCVWNNKLRFMGGADIHESSWITGCDYLPGIRRVVACTERSLTIWDNRAKGKNQTIFTIKPIEHSPQCMSWVPLYNSAHEDALIFGDDQGYINLMRINAKDLTAKNSKSEDKRFTQNYTIHPHFLENPIKRRKLHDDWVVKVKYFPELRCFASCSPSSTSSFVLEEIERLTDDGAVRGVAIPKGVNAFEYSVRANIIATGGVDKIIRVWHPHIFTRPTGKLIGHLFTIVDITVNEKDQHLISLSTARVFRIWDIHTLTSLQVFTDNEERPGEKRIYSILFDNKHERLLSGSSVIDVWPLTRSVHDTLQVPHTHDRPITQVLINKELNHLVTVCQEPVLKVWEVETGKLVHQINEPHGQGVEVTSLALDKSGYRMATGASDGTIKVWDFGSGQELKLCKPVKTVPEDLEQNVTGMQYTQQQEDRLLVAMGWNNCMKVLIDTNDSKELQILCEFSDVLYSSRTPSVNDYSKSPHPLPDIGQTNVPSSNLLKKEHILGSNELSSMAYVHQTAVITGCTNGNVILWNVEKAVVDKLFVLPDTDYALSHTSENFNRKRRQNPDFHNANVISILKHRIRKEHILAKRKKSKDSSSKSNQDDVTTAESRSPLQSRQSMEPERVSNLPGNTEKEPENLQTIIEDSRSETVESVQQLRNTASGKEKAESIGVAEEKDADDNDDVVLDQEFEPIVVTCHNDSLIRFWDLEGELLREVSPITRRQGSAITALTNDEDCNIIVTGDDKGYLTLWSVGAFLKDPDNEKTESIKQLLCWRAHMTKICHLEYNNTQTTIISSSTDGSVRIWWSDKGRFVGFYGQHRPFNIPNSEEAASSTPVLPYDITEGPLAPLRTHSANQKMRDSQKMDYPLIFDNEKWKPHRRSAKSTRKSLKLSIEDKKFFQALKKPQAYNYHLNSSTSGETKHGAVFRALPVYRVNTPARPKTPAARPWNTEDESPFLLGLQAPKQVKTNKKSRTLAPNTTGSAMPSPTIPGNLSKKR